jgi:hypothetical protein
MPQAYGPPPSALTTFSAPPQPHPMQGYGPPAHIDPRAYGSPYSGQASYPGAPPYPYPPPYPSQQIIQVVQSVQIKASFNHAPHVVLDVLTCGVWLPIHLICWACH